MFKKYKTEDQARAVADDLKEQAPLCDFAVVMAPDCSYSVAILCNGVFLGFGQDWTHQLRENGYDLLRAI